MPKKSAKKTVLPDPLPNGEVLQDIAKKKWVLGPSIGIGGFGEIYSAAEYSAGVKKPSNYPYVVKIEPHDNGPLFCEMHFFMRTAKLDMIKTWCTDNKIASLGMPRYIGSGSHEHANKKYRFLVMDRYGKDLWRIFLDHKKQFPVPTVYRIALQLLDVLEYIHNNEYIHADIKGANILLGLTKQTQNQVFLVDYGLASKYTKKEFKPDPRKAHNGTIEYTSCDAHDGVPTRRGDIEILAYNMVQWMGTVLPWEKNLSDPVAVHNSKKNNLADINSLLKTCFGKRKVPGALKEFLDYIPTMKYDTVPDYKKLRNILLKGLKTEGGSVTGPLEFKTTNKHKAGDQAESETPEKRIKLTPKQKKSEELKRRVRKTVEVKDIDDSESEVENIPIKKTRGRPKKKENLSESETEEVNTPRNRKENSKPTNGYNVETVDSESEVEYIPVKKSRGRPKKGANLGESETEEVNTPKGQKENSEPANGYNAEMLRIQKKIAERKAVTPKKTVKKFTVSSGRNDSSTNLYNSDSDIVDATPPEKLVGRKKRNVHTPTVYGGAESESPRSFRQRR